MSDVSGINSNITTNIAPNGVGRITALVVQGVILSLVAWVATWYAPHVASLAALRSYTSAYATTVIRDDYAAGNGAPALTYHWAAACPGTADNIALYISPSGSGGCWSAAADNNRFDTREWGAKNDSTPTSCGTDNAGAFNAAFTALGAGAKLYNDGPSCLKSTVTMTQSGQGVVCKGGGFSGTHHDVGAAVLTAPAPLVAGTPSMTMLTATSATIQAISGIQVDCVLAGNGVGATGIDALSIRGGNYNVTVSHFSTTGIKAEINASQTDAAGSSYNTYNIYVDQGNSTDGAAYQCFGTATWDCSQDKFPVVTGVWNGRVPAMDFDGADSEYIDTFTIYDNKMGNACGLRYRAGATWGQTARNNRAHYVSVSTSGSNGCPAYAEGTEAGGGRVVASNMNTIDMVDTATGGSNPPLIGTPGGNAENSLAITSLNMLWWGTNLTPPGFQYYSQSYGTILSQQTSAGIITNTGYISNINHGSNVVVTFNATWSAIPPAGTYISFPNTCLSIYGNPNAGIPWHSTCVTAGSTTTLTFYNDSTTTNAGMIWSAMGY